MGCGCTKQNKTSSDVCLNQDVSPSKRLHKVSVVVGDQVDKLADNNTPHVVFIFGGPGSFKGRVVDDLVQTYGFKYISAEDVILEELPKKLQLMSKVESMSDLMSLLNTDNSLLTLEWLFDQITIRIEKNPRCSYIIDIITNLRIMLRSDYLCKDCSDCLKKFETRFPVCMALNLAIPKDKIIKLMSSHAGKRVDKNDKSSKETEIKAVQSDEVDLSKTQKRATLYENNMSPYMEYFKDRLVTIDVSCGLAESISYKICHYFNDCGFKPRTVPSIVILFSFGESDGSGVDIELFDLEKVRLADFVVNSQASMDEMLKLLYQEILKRIGFFKNFLVDLTGTSVTPQAFNKSSRRLINFVDVVEGPLEQFVFLTADTPVDKLPRDQTFKAVLSTEGESFIFGQNVDTDICILLTKRIIETKDIILQEKYSEDMSLRV